MSIIPTIKPVRQWSAHGPRTVLRPQRLRDRHGVAESRAPVVVCGATAGGNPPRGAPESAGAIHKAAAGVVAGIVLTLLAGCKGVPTKSETAARQQAQAVANVYRPQGQRPALPVLTTNSTLGDFLRFAMLNQPQVEATYEDWLASVEQITSARSLPDPQFTFQTFNAATLLSAIMPGLMVQFPGPGKLGAQAAVASAQSRTKYFAFETAVLQTAFNQKKAFYPLYFLEERLRINRETLALIADLEKLARAQNAVGKVTLQDVLRAQIEQDRLVTEIANLEDSRRALLAQFKAALGLRAGQPDPPVPRRFESTPLELDSNQLLATALARNPRLQAMEAEVRMAEAGLELARKAKVPDFTAGLSADVQAAPVMWSPQFGVTLPVWRDKIAAQIAAAQAGKRAAEARLSAEQSALAVDFAAKLYSYREASRNLALVRDQLLPKARQSLEVARISYLSGQLDFFNLSDTERTLLDFQLTEVAARTERELALAELSLLIVGVPPAGAPILATP